MGDPATVVVAVPTGLTAAFCLLRCARGDDEHARSVDGFHALMGAAMVAMLLAPLGRDVGRVGLAVFTVGALYFLLDLWSDLRVGARPRARGRLDSRVRVALGSVGMAVMLVPTAFAEGSMAATPGMTDMRMGPEWPAPVVLLIAALVAATALVVLWRGPSRRARAGAACEVVMAGAMAFMAVTMWSA